MRYRAASTLLRVLITRFTANGQRYHSCMSKGNLSVDVTSFYRVSSDTADVNIISNVYIRSAPIG